MEFHKGTIFDDQSKLISCDKIIVTVCLDKELRIYENWLSRYTSQRKTDIDGIVALFRREVGKDWDSIIRLDESGRIVMSINCREYRLDRGGW